MVLIFTSLASVVTVVVWIRIAWRWVWRVLFPVFPMLFLRIAFLFNQFTGIVIIWQTIFLYEESDSFGSRSGSPGTCDFPFCSVKSVGSVGKLVGRFCRVGSRVFVLTGIDSIGDVFLLFVFVPRGAESKYGWLIELFWLPKSWFSLLVSKLVLAL